MSFIFFLLYLFCTFIRPQEWVPGLIEQPLVDYLSIATIIFLSFEMMGSKTSRLARVPQNMLILGLFASILMSHIVHTYFEGLSFAFNQFIVNFILFFIVLNVNNSEWKLKAAVWFIAILSFSLVFQGIHQMEYGIGWAGQPLYYGENAETRITWVGVFNDPNDLALVFALGTGIVLSFIFGRTGIISKIAGSIMLGYFSYGVFLTNSRSGMVALMATIFFYFIRRTKKYILGSVLGSLGAAAIFLLGPSRKAIINVEEAAAYNRVELWYEGILMMKSNPVFGVGYGMFTDQLPQTAHNSFILAGAELGFVGLFFFIGLIYASFKGLSIVQKADPKLQTYATGLQAALIGYCTAAFFLSRTYVILPYMLFALSGSLLHIAQKRNPQVTFKFTAKDAGFTALWSLGTLVFAYVLIKITF